MCILTSLRRACCVPPWPRGLPLAEKLSCRHVVKAHRHPTHDEILAWCLHGWHRNLVNRLTHGVCFAQEAAEAGHTLSVDMLSLSDGKLPSLSVDAMGEFQTESFRCESGFQMLLGG